MTRVLADAADAGRSCPYCRFPLKEGAPAERCDACGCLHHEDCWMDGHGCAVLGCSGAGSGAASASALRSGLPRTRAHEPSAPPPGIAASPRGRNGTPLLILASVIAVAGAALGAAIVSGALNGASRSVRGTASASHPVVHVVSHAEQASSRRAIIALLQSYARDYSEHDLGGLAAIFSPRVKRHGLAAGGCSVAEGRRAVLRDYASQFDQGTGAYALVGLSPSEIEFRGSGDAHLNGNYRIATGGSGFVDFDFAEEEGNWKITQVYATCD